MKRPEAALLKNGDIVEHKQFGECIVQQALFTQTSTSYKRELFGLIIAPNTDYGRQLLAQKSGMPLGTPLLEDSLRMLGDYKRLQEVA